MWTLSVVAVLALLETRTLTLKSCPIVTPWTISMATSIFFSDSVSPPEDNGAVVSFKTAIIISMQNDLVIVCKMNGKFCCAGHVLDLIPVLRQTIILPLLLSMGCIRACHFCQYFD